MREYTGLPEIQTDIMNLNTNEIQLSNVYVYPRKLQPALTRWVKPGWYADGEQAFTVQAGVIYYMPIWVSEPTTYIRIGIVVNAGIAGTADLRIFRWNEGLPGALVLSAGTVDTSVAGEKEITISQLLTNDYYFLAVRCSSTPELKGINTALAVVPPVSGVATSNTPMTSGVCLTVNSAYADPAPAPTAVATALAALVQLREN